MKIKKTISLATWLIGLSLSTFFKLSFVWGSSTFMFSGFTIVAPLLGSILNPIGSLSILGSYFGVKYLLGGTALTLGIPTVCATLSWASNTSENSLLSFGINALLPLMCMAVFIMHPTGSAAFAYSLYWLIPVGLCCLNRCEILTGTFSTALQSTFVAHAVGSVIWLYTLQLPATKWIALIPIVAIERFVFAGAATLLYYSAVSSASYLSRLTYKRLLKNQI